ncbi:hypothetical protein J6590_079549, partial [Homalodisca vitripennis]
VNCYSHVVNVEFGYLSPLVPCSLSCWLEGRFTPITSSVISHYWSLVPCHVGLKADSHQSRVRLSLTIGPLFLVLLA